jgi:3-hydroxyacyl-[acyl-carrier-protein] dehydratase
MTTHTVMDIHQILKKLPHRYPILLVDRVLEMEGQEHQGAEERHDQRALLRRPLPAPPGDAGRADARSHGAGRRAAGLLRRRHRLDDNSVIYFAGIDGARFKRPVEPGDQLVMDVTLTAKRRHLQVQGRRRASATRSPARPS